MPQIPPVTKAFILACVGVFCLQFLAPGIETPFELWPLQSGRFQVWQLFSYAFLHGGVEHLFFNMLGLFVFGPELEQVWGWRRYLQMLVASTLSAALAQLAFTFLLGTMAPTLGASGAIFGLLLSYGMLFPNRIIVPLLPPIPMRAKYYVAIFGGIEVWLAFAQASGDIAHIAHVGGMLGAWLLVRYWRRGGRR